MTAPLRKRSGFTAIEIVMTIGILGLASGLSVPMYRQYLVRNDLEIARQNVSQGVERAKFLSQVAMNDSSWGFSTDAVPGRGVLFMGSSYATRNTAFDELYTLPTTIQVDGITEVSFAKITGLPDQTGTITLIALNGERRSINVTVGSDGEVSSEEDWLDICVNPYSGSPIDLKVPDSLWTYYQSNGAIMGLCDDAPGGAVCGNNIVEAGEQCDDGNTTGGDGCDAECQNEGGGDPPNVSEDGDDEVDVDDNYTCEITILGADLDPNGYQMHMTFSNKGLSGGWNEPFGNWNKAVDGNVNCGSGIGPNCGTLPITAACGSNYSSSDPFRVRVTSQQKKKSWYDGTSNNHWQKFIFINNSGDDDNAYVLVDDDPIPSNTPLNDPATIKSYVDPYLNLNTGKVTLGNNQALWLFELGTSSPDLSSDFQDLAVLVTFSPN